VSILIISFLTEPIQIRRTFRSQFVLFEDFLVNIIESLNANMLV